MNRLFILIAIACISFTITGNRKTRIWLIGDSTIAIKERKAYPESGWGMAFAYFFNSTIVVENRAKNGRSTKSFMAEGLWKSVTDELKEGDHVFIQFGHNDEGKEKVGRYTTPEEFKANLETFVKETRSKKAIPVLITPVARRRFDTTGKVIPSHPIYSDAVRETALRLNVPLIDLDAKSMGLLQEFGKENSKWLFNHLQPGEHPNYPNGLKDDTHFNELGARKMAEIVLAGIRSLKLEIADHIYIPPVKK